ncbi:hypothetical protein GCM10022293_49800 [Azospirillum formosense]
MRIIAPMFGDQRQPAVRIGLVPGGDEALGDMDGVRHGGTPSWGCPDRPDTHSIVIPRSGCDYVAGKGKAFDRAIERALVGSSERRITPRR